MKLLFYLVLKIYSTLPLTGFYHCHQFGHGGVNLRYMFRDESVYELAGIAVNCSGIIVYLRQFLAALGAVTAEHGGLV